MKTLRMCVGILVIVTAAAAARTEAATITNLNMTLYHQQTRYWCGPATVEMTVKYLTGRYYTQAYLAHWMGTTYRGTSTSNSLRALRHFSNQAYGFSAFSRTRIIHNINYKRPVPVSFVEKNGSNTRDTLSDGMPQPVSSTDKLATRPTECTLTSRAPPSGIASKLFKHRFKSA